MSRVTRIDRGELLKKPEVTPEGYLRLDGKIARTGIQIYRRQDGTEVRELRRSDAVFDQAYLDSFAAIPLTDCHPSRLLDQATAKRHAVGAVAGARKLDDKWVAGSLSIWDKDAIDSVKRGRVQLSVGYSCEVLDESGEYEGQRYDSVQTNIVANHLALVDAARAGSEARLRLDDSGNAIEDEADFGPLKNPVVASLKLKENVMSQKFKLDGFEVEVADANTQSIIERAVASAKKDADDKLVNAKAAMDEAIKACDAAKAELAAVKSKHDVLDAKLQAFDAAGLPCKECKGKGMVGDEKCEGCGGSGKLKMDSALSDKLDASIARILIRDSKSLVAKRVALLNTAARIVPTNMKLDEKSDIEIKQEDRKSVV